MSGPIARLIGRALRGRRAGDTHLAWNQPAIAQAPVSLPKTMSNRPDRNFGSPLEASKAMKILSPFQCRLAIAKRR